MNMCTNNALTPFEQQAQSIRDTESGDEKKKDDFIFLLIYA